MYTKMRAAVAAALLAGLGLASAEKTKGAPAGAPQASAGEDGALPQERRERLREAIGERLRARAQVRELLERYEQAPEVERPQLRRELEGFLSETLDRRLAQAEARSARAGRIAAAARRRKPEILRLALAILLDEGQN